MGMSEGKGRKGGKYHIEIRLQWKKAGEAFAATVFFLMARIGRALIHEAWVIGLNMFLLQVTYWVSTSSASSISTNERAKNGPFVPSCWPWVHEGDFFFSLSTPIRGDIMMSEIDLSIHLYLHLDRLNERNTKKESWQGEGGELCAFAVPCSQLLANNARGQGLFFKHFWLKHCKLYKEYFFGEQAVKYANHTYCNQLLM